MAASSHGINVLPCRSFRTPDGRKQVQPSDAPRQNDPAGGGLPLRCGHQCFVADERGGWPDQPFAAQIFGGKVMFPIAVMQPLTADLPR